MPVRREWRSWRSLLVAGLAVLLASVLVACDGSSDDDPPPAATETLAPPAVPIEPSAPATPAPLPETPPTTPETPPFTPEAPVPEPPTEQRALDPAAASSPSDEPAPPGTGASEPPAAPKDPAVPDPTDPPEDPPAAGVETLPTTPLTYGAPSTTGSVTDDGDYAFLTDPADLTSAITTYEGLRTGLRDGTRIGLVLHQNDSAGTSRADFYELVEAGDVVEWREADGCWMRYVIRAVHADPTGDPPRTLLTLQVYSHPYPDGCSGTLGTTGSRTFTWSPGWFATGHLPGPVWHGAGVYVPEGWSGPLPEETRVTPIATPWPLDPLPDPDLGPDWSGSLSLGYGDVIEGTYEHTDGGFLDVWIYRLTIWPRSVAGVATDRATAAHIREFRVIDGWAARVGYYPVRGDTTYAGVSFYDAANGTLYGFFGGTVAQRNDPEALIELARQFLPAAP